jgi:endonuclease G
MTMDKVSQATREEFRRRVERSQVQRDKVRSMVASGQSTRADEDERRLNAVLMRKQARGGKEALQGLSNDLQPIAFMTEGAAVRRAVAKIVVDTDEYHEEGSGFLVSPGVLITNQHVIRDTAAAHGAIVIFDYELDELGQRRNETRYRLDPDRLELYSPEEGGLDYALVAVGERIEGGAALAELGYCALNNSKDRHFIGMNVNIIQHPGGERKQIACRNNLLTHRTETTLLYETDTNVGSSGSPVFNDDWEVVALHHYGEPFTELFDMVGRALPLNVNEGIRISRIYDDLATNKLRDIAEPKRELLEAVLSAATIQAPHLRLPQIERRPPTSQRESVKPGEVEKMAPEKSNPELTLNIPVVLAPMEINLRVGGALGAGNMGREQPTQPSRVVPQLTRKPEGKRLDRDYANRNGFDADFIDAVPVDLAKLVAPLANRIAPLLDGTRIGELKYQNFSVIMDNRRDLALLTATNIDSESYMNVDRKTGQVGDAEGETWYKDRRISDEYCLDQSFYSAWSHKFDRGHLTRRNDPTWGPTKTEAERANADTFHFTNCTPQHFRFNQSADFWQGIERYVLEQGVLQPGRAKRLTVLQGPVLDDRDDPWAGDVQVPAQFWKIVIWNGANGPRAVGMLANQSDLFDEDRINLRRPDEDKSVEVRQFHVPLSRLAKLTKLDLSDLLAIDTFKQGLPGAGEAAVRITKWADMGF